MIAKLRDFVVCLLNLFRKKQLDEDMLSEMQHHIDMEVHRMVKQGIPEKAAKAAAFRNFGNALKIQEEERENRTVFWIEQWVRDFKHLGRSLWKVKGFSLIVIGTLALCIGVNATILSALYDLVIRPLPFEESERLVKIYNYTGDSVGRSGESSWAQYADFKAQASLFEGFALMQDVTKTVEVGGISQLMDGKSVTSEIFEVTDVRPVIGTFFDETANQAGNHRVVVIGETLWETRYERSPDVLGMEIKFLDGSHVIVGVAPKSLESFQNGTQFFVPMVLRPRLFDARLRYLEGLPLHLWARLKEGVSKKAGLEQLTALEERWWSDEAPVNIKTFLERSGGRTISLNRPNKLNQSFVLLQFGAVFVLIVGCVNVLNLFLSRAAKRCYELAVRNSLGAGKKALSRLMFIESLVLSLLAFAAGIGCARIGLWGINHYLAIADPSIGSISFDPFVLWVALASAVGIAWVVGVLPFWILWRMNVMDKPDNAGRNASLGSFLGKLSDVLVVVQVVAAFVLLIGASLLLRSFVNVLGVDPGFNSEKVIQSRVTVPNEYRSSVNGDTLRSQVIESVKRIPGVENVAIAFRSPVANDEALQKESVHLRVSPYAEGETASVVYVHAVTEDFFQTLGIPLSEGRAFNASDTVGHQTSGDLVVDQRFANMFFPEGPSVGEQISISQRPRNGRPWSQIIGVVRVAHFAGLDLGNPDPVLYKPLRGAKANHFSLLVRTNRSENVVLEEIRGALRDLDPKLVLHDSMNLKAALENLLVNRKGVMWLVSGFASIAILLSALGLYGLLSFEVSQRQNEIGVRMAVGATQSDVLSHIVGRGLRKVVLGMLLGLVLSFYLNGFIEDQLFNVLRIDPLSYGAVSISVLIAASLASYMPARKATGVDPVETLRSE